MYVCGLLSEKNTTWSDVIKNPKKHQYDGNITWKPWQNSDGNKDDVSSGFEIGKDSNRFYHNNGDYTDSGFKGVTTYALDNLHFENLTSNSSSSEKNKIKKMIGKKWNGACYGVTMSVGLLYNGYIKIGDLTDKKGVSNYYEMPYPYENSELPNSPSKLLNMIHYYHLSQNLKNGGKKDASISTTCNSLFFQNTINWLMDYDSIPVFLRKLVEASMKSEAQFFCYSTNETNHAVLVTSCEYDSDKKEYSLKLYDVNSLYRFISMTIKDDFSAFSFVDGNGDKVNEKNYVCMYLLDWSKVKKGNSIRTSTVDTHTKLDLLTGNDFKITNSKGDYLQYKNNVMSGNMKIYNLETFEIGKEVHLIVEIDSDDKFTLSNLGAKIDIEIYNSENFSALAGEKIDGAVIKCGKELQIKGKSYRFKAYTSTDKISTDEDGLVSIEAKAAGNTVILRNKNSVRVSSEKNLTNIKTKNYARTKVEETKYDNKSKINVTSKPINSSKTSLKKAKITLKTSTYSYDGKAKKPALVVKVGNKTLKKNSHYKIRYKNNKNIGTASVTITGIGNYKDSVTKKFKIVPKGTSISKAFIKKKKLNVQWKKQTKNTSGYQIQYSTSIKFTGKTSKSKKISNTKTTKYKFANLKNEKRYYVRIRTYKKVAGKTYYSAWSKISKVKVK